MYKGKNIRFCSKQPKIEPQMKRQKIYDANF